MKANRKPPTREGQLEKLAKGSKFEKGFFEVTNTGYLNYYKKQGGKNSDAIYLRGCTVRVDPDDNAIVLLQTGELLGGGNVLVACGSFGFHSMVRMSLLQRTSCTRCAPLVGPRH
jgi:hypothetical protein